MNSPPCKYVVILPDGAADQPVQSLGGRTPLQAARKPHMDSIARSGRQGRVVTVPPGMSPGSDVATLSLFGYDPKSEYTGRAPLEAAARNLTASQDDLIFRCNFVTIHDGRMLDFTAGHISSIESAQLIESLNRSMGGQRYRFHAGVSYRNLMVLANAEGCNAACTPPHDIPDQPAASHLPSGRGADELVEVMRCARTILGKHEVNRLRLQRNEKPATDIWLWGQGRTAALESFEQRFGLKGVAIAAVDLIRGIAKAVGITVLDVPGATGFLDTDYAAKGRAAVSALDHYDIVFVHIEAPDEAGHLGDAPAKQMAIERIDENIVGPILLRLQSFDRWRILIAPDHPTPVGTRGHDRAPPPFAMAGYGIKADETSAFDETRAEQSRWLIQPGYDLMRHLLQ